MPSKTSLMLKSAREGASRSTHRTRLLRFQFAVERLGGLQRAGLLQGGDILVGKILKPITRRSRRLRR